MTIKAQHAFRTDRNGLPITLDFSPQAWKKLTAIKHNGSSYPKGGWIEGQAQAAPKAFTPKEAQAAPKANKEIKDMTAKELKAVIEANKLDINPAQPLPDLKAAVIEAMTSKTEDNE